MIDDIRFFEINDCEVMEREGIKRVIESTPDTILDTIVNAKIHERTKASMSMLSMANDKMRVKDHYFTVDQGGQQRVVSDHRPLCETLEALRVLTFNVMSVTQYLSTDSERIISSEPYGHLLDTETRYMHITNVVNSSNADVACIQECDYGLYTYLSAFADYNAHFIPQRLKYGQHGSDTGIWIKECGLCLLTRINVDLTICCYTGNKGYTNGMNVRSIKVHHKETGTNVVFSHVRNKTSEDSMKMIKHSVNLGRTAIAGDMNINVNDLIIALKNANIGIVHVNVMQIAHTSDSSYEFVNFKCLDHIRKVKVIVKATNDEVRRDCDNVKAYVYTKYCENGRYYMDVQIVGTYVNRYMNNIVCRIPCNKREVNCGCYILMSRTRNAWFFSLIS